MFREIVGNMEMAMFQKSVFFCTTRYIMYFVPGAKQTILHHRRHVLYFVMGHPTDILNHDDTFLFV